MNKKSENMWIFISLYFMADFVKMMVTTTWHIKEVEKYATKAKLLFLKCYVQFIPARDVGPLLYCVADMLMCCLFVKLICITFHYHDLLWYIVKYILRHMFCEIKLILFFNFSYFFVHNFEEIWLCQFIEITHIKNRSKQTQFALSY